MNLHLWISFVAASTGLLLIPGPTVLQCVGDAMANNQRQNWSTVLGVGVGDTVAMVVSLLGAGALLQSSAAAFTVMKTAGGLYLIYLGLRALWGASKAEGAVLATGDSTKRETAAVRFSKACTITMLNPKSILFFVAFVPQFMVPQLRFATQAGILVVTFVALAMSNAWLYMAFAKYLVSRLRTRAAQRGAGYVSGGLLLAAGSVTLALKRSR